MMAEEGVKSVSGNGEGCGRRKERAAATCFLSRRYICPANEEMTAGCKKGDENGIHDFQLLQTPAEKAAKLYIPEIPSILVIDISCEWMKNGVVAVQVECRFEKMMPVRSSNRVRARGVSA
jgi:hypothetical protein